MNTLFQQINNNRMPNMLENLTRNNPQLAQIMQEIKQSGGDARSLFYSKAKQMGIDPQSILNQLK